MSGLSPRELEVLQQAARGLTDAESAAETCHGRSTVATHRKNLRAKLDARDMAHAVAIGYELGLVQAIEALTPSRQLTAWQQLDEREQLLFEAWLAGTIGNRAYVQLWRTIDRAFADLATAPTRGERLRDALEVKAA